MSVFDRIIAASGFDSDRRGFDVHVAAEIGIGPAVFLSQLIFRLRNRPPHQDGHCWYPRTQKQWHAEMPFYNIRQVQRILKKLEDDGYILSEDKEVFEGVKIRHYRLSDLLESAILQPDAKTAGVTTKCRLGHDKMSSGSRQNVVVQYKDLEDLRETKEKREEAISTAACADGVGCVQDQQPEPPRQKAAKYKPQGDWDEELTRLEASLPTAARLPWKALKDTRATENKTGAVATSVLARLLADVLERKQREGWTDEQLAFGLSRGKFNETYIAKAARGYSAGGSNPPGLPRRQPEAPVVYTDFDAMFGITKEARNGKE